MAVKATPDEFSYSPDSPGISNENFVLFNTSLSSLAMKDAETGLV